MFPLSTFWVCWVILDRCHQAFGHLPSGFCHDAVCFAGEDQADHSSETSCLIQREWALKASEGIWRHLKASKASGVTGGILRQNFAKRLHADWWRSDEDLENLSQGKARRIWAREGDLGASSDIHQWHQWRARMLARAWKRKGSKRRERPRRRRHLRQLRQLRHLRHLRLAFCTPSFNLTQFASPTVRVPVLFAKPSGTRARRARASGVGASEPETLQVQGVKLKELNVIHVIYIIYIHISCCIPVLFVCSHWTHLLWRGQHL